MIKITSSLILIVGIIIVIAGAAIVVSFILDNFYGLQIQNPTNPIVLKQYQNPPSVKYELFYNEGGSWNDVIVYPTVENSGGTYLETFSENHGTIEIGDSGTHNLEFVHFNAIDTEGSEIIYEVNMNVNASGILEDTHPITVKIDSNISDTRYRESLQDNEEIIFIDLYSDTLVIPEDTEDFFEFKIKKTTDQTYENITVKVDFYNNSGKFLEYDIVPLSFKKGGPGSDSGIVEFPLTAIESEGKELKYEGSLVLYSGNIRMDTKTIQVIVTP